MQGRELTADMLKKMRSGNLKDSGAATVKPKAIPEEMRKGWDALDKSGELEKVKATDYNLWVAMFYNRWKKFPTSLSKEYDSEKTLEYICGAERLKKELADTTGDEPKVKKSAIPDELFMGYDALDKANKIEVIQKRDYTLFAVVYFDRFGQWPQGSSDKMDHNVKMLYQDALKQFKLKEMLAMSWPDLMGAGRTEELKAIDPEQYKERYFKYYGVYPKF